MARTIQQGFADLRSNLEITNLQATTVSIRQSMVRETLARGLTVLDTFLTGSYARSTMIAPLRDADVDIFAVLDGRYFHHYNHQNGGCAGLLDYAKRTLQATYSQTPDISRNGQAVTIRFNDFVVDVVCGFYRQNGGYLIANALTNQWLSTDPKEHVRLMSLANQANNGLLVPIIKMIKAWNRNDGSFFRSFHLEVMARQIFQNVTISDHSSGVRFFFDKARYLARQPILDPAGYGDNVGNYIAHRVDEASARLNNAYSIALSAEQFGQMYPSSAFEQWRKLFSNHFPAYG